MQANMFLQESAQRVEQQKRRKLMKNRRDEKAKCAKFTRQYIKIGKLVCGYFPSLLDFESKNGEAFHNELEFLEYFLALHHNNPKIMQQLRDMFECRGL